MDLLVWQLIDSAFPSGGFAHSGGLEASVQHGSVSDVPGVYAFAARSVAQCGRSALPLVSASHRDPADFARLDGIANAFLSNPVANRASRAQGRALLTSAARSFPHAGLDGLDAPVRSGLAAGHHAPMFGRVFSLLGVPIGDTRRAFLFIAARGVASAAVRLGIMGSYEAQSMQAELAAQIDAVAAECAEIAPHDIAQTAPLIDLYQSTHDRMYSRLFQS